MNPQLVNYVKEYTAKGYSRKAIRGYLLQYGWPAAQVDEAFKLVRPKRSLLKLSLIPALAIIIIILFYFTYISPAFVSKLEMEKPALLGQSDSTTIETLEATGEPIDAGQEQESAGQEESSNAQDSMTTQAGQGAVAQDNQSEVAQDSQGGVAQDNQSAQDSQDQSQDAADPDTQDAETDQVTDNQTVSDKPSKQVNGSHIEYIMNELEAYKLHSNPLNGEQPIIKLTIPDLEETYSITVVDNNVQSTLAEPENPDIVININQDDLISFFISEDKSLLVSMYKEGKVVMQTLKDEEELALKGYKAIYDSLEQ